MAADPSKRMWGKVAIISGSSSGIGAATALEFTRLGAAVTLTSYDAEELEGMRQRVEDINCGQPKPLVVVGDITKDETRIRIVEETIRRFGKLDILINNAGIVRHGTIERTSLQQLDELFAIIFRAPFHMTMLAVPHLLETKGCIVFTSSVLSVIPVPELLAFAACKAAVDNFTRGLAVDLGPRGVRVNSVRPGYINTNILFKHSDLTQEEAEMAHENASKTNLFRRVGEPEEIAKAMAFLASDDSSFITGMNLLVDGGYNIMPFQLPAE